MTDAFSEGDLRKAFWVPCKNQADLHTWIHVYLGLDIPDCIVDEESTSSPMGVIWEVYDTACRSVDNGVEDDSTVDISQLLAYSARDAFKTVLASILEVLCLVHLERNVAHMAAIEPQAQKAQRYVKEYFAKPILRDFVTTQNERRVELVHYVHRDTGDCITYDQFKALMPQERVAWDRKENYIQIVIATMAGANSEHVSFMVVDEVDVITNPRAYEQAKLIPSPWLGKMPITLIISTRKTSVGLVQQEIDKALSTGLEIRHWNIIDVTVACPASRHKPEEPKVDLWRSDELLRHSSVADYELLDHNLKNKYICHKGAFAGCARCPIFSSCKGRLTTHQHSTSPLLKPIKHVINIFGKVSVEMAIAELMSRKAANTGLIYPRANPELHKLTAAQMAEKITGEPFPETFGKADLINLMIANGVRFWAGCDWGFTHLFVLASAAAYGLDLFIFDVIAQAGLDPEEKLQHAERVKLWNPTIFADPEAPDQIKLFKKKRFAMRDWKKTAGSVKMGIDVVRMKLFPGVGPPQLFFLKGDSACELAFEHLSKYHFVFDAAGELTEIPSENNDDIPDAIRYLCLNLFTPKGKVTASAEEQLDASKRGPQLRLVQPTDMPPPGAPPTTTNYLNYYIQQNLSGQEVVQDPAGRRGKRGRLTWSFD